MTDDTTNEQHMARLHRILAAIDESNPFPVCLDLTHEETAAVRWARDQVVELRRERDEARAKWAEADDPDTFGPFLALGRAREAYERGVATNDFTALRELLGVGRG